jgi:hypothetical protein
MSLSYHKFVFKVKQKKIYECIKFNAIILQDLQSSKEIISYKMNSSINNHNNKIFLLLNVHNIVKKEKNLITFTIGSLVRFF